MGRKALEDTEMQPGDPTPEEIAAATALYKAQHLAMMRRQEPDRDSRNEKRRKRRAAEGAKTRGPRSR